MIRSLVLTSLILGCAGSQAPDTIPRVQEGDIHLPVPSAREHLAGYLGIRHRLTGEVPWVVVCGGISAAAVDSMASSSVRAGIVRSLQFAGADGCVPPSESRAEPAVGAILVQSIEFTETSAMLTAQRWRGARWPFEWRERFRFLLGDQQLSMDFFSAID